MVPYQARRDMTESCERVLEITPELSVHTHVPWGGHVLPRCGALATLR